MRLAARLGPVPKKQAQSVPAFDPVKLLRRRRHRSAAATGRRASRTSNAKTKELSGVLPNEDGQELDAQEVLALVMRAQAAEKDAGSTGADLLAGRAQRIADALAPQTTALQKTVFETEETDGVTPPALSDRDKLQDNSLYASFYHAAAKQGIPHDLIMQVMRIHAYGTDFRQRVRAGDGVELFFDMKGEDRGIDGELGGPARDLHHGRRQDPQVLPLPHARRGRRLLRRGRQHGAQVPHAPAGARRGRAPHLEIRHAPAPDPAHQAHAQRRGLGRCRGHPDPGRRQRHR